MFVPGTGDGETVEHGCNRYEEKLFREVPPRADAGDSQTSMSVSSRRMRLGAVLTAFRSQIRMLQGLGRPKPIDRLSGTVRV